MPKLFAQRSSPLLTQVDDLALVVQVVERDQSLPHNVSHDGDWDPLVLVQPAAPKASIVGLYRTVARGETYTHTHTHTHTGGFYT